MLTYVVMDLETDGLDEHAGYILEVAAVGLDEHLQEVFRYSTPITQGDLRWAEDMSPIVREMHEASGLTEDVNSGASALDHPLLDEWDEDGYDIHPYIEKADELLAAAIDSESDGELVVLAGSGVSHMDQRWIKQHMPETHARLRHGTVDVGCMRRWYYSVVGDNLTDADSRKTHRALDDVDCHIEELMEFAGLFVRDALLRDQIFAPTEQETHQ